MKNTRNRFLPEGFSAGEFAKRVLTQVNEDRCPAYAAGMAYYFLFALFPFLLFLTALLAFLPVPDLTEIIMGWIREAVPADAYDLVHSNLNKLVTNRKGGILSLGVFLALWTSSSAVVAIMEGLDNAYGVPENRPFWKLRGTAVLLVVGLALFLVLTAALVAFGPLIGGAIAAKFGVGGLFHMAWNILRWPLVLVMMAVAVSAIYYFGPNVKQRWRWITPGSVVTMTVWVLASVGFSFYVNNFGSYDKTYGSIGAIIVLLTWLFISGLVLLVGGEINAELKKLESRKE